MSIYKSRLILPFCLFLINKTIDLHQEKLERKRAEDRHKAGG